jgi:two-component system heavy metal sensor histidine kinase CusS
MKFFKRLTLAARLAILFGIAVAVVFTVVAVHLFQTSAKHLRNRDDAALMACMDLLRHYVETSPSVESLRTDSHKLLDMSLAQSGVVFAVWTSGGDLVTASTPETQSLRARAFADAGAGAIGVVDNVKYQGKHARLTTTAVQVRGEAGALQLVVAHEDEERVAVLKAYRSDLLWTAIVGALITALLGYGIARRAMRPIKSIARTSGLITASQLNERLPVEDAPPELEEMVRTFNGMLDRLEDSFRRLSQFSSDIAHDLRTPLSNMMVATQVALGRPRSTSEYEALLASNIEELERLTRMVEEMLFLARVDNPATVIERGQVDVRAELDKVAEFYRALAQERDLSIECEGEATVGGDRVLLQRAIHNLISNAVRYASQGGVIEARISGGEGKSWAELSITNPGTGIAQEHLPRVFDRFYRADSARQSRKLEDGTGLGLAIVKSIVQLHGGEVRVTSDASKTTFVVRLPISRMPTLSKSNAAAVT